MWVREKYVDLSNIDHFLLVDSNERRRESLKNFNRPADSLVH